MCGLYYTMHLDLPSKQDTEQDLKIQLFSRACVGLSLHRTSPFICSAEIRNVRSACNNMMFEIFLSICIHGIRTYERVWHLLFIRSYTCRQADKCCNAIKSTQRVRQAGRHLAAPRQCSSVNIIGLKTAQFLVILWMM